MALPFPSRDGLGNAHLRQQLSENIHTQTATDSEELNSNKQQHYHNKKLPALKLPAWHFLQIRIYPLLESLLLKIVWISYLKLTNLKPISTFTR